MLAIPPSLLNEINLRAGTLVEVSLGADSLIIRPSRPRYSLDTLLTEAEQSGVYPCGPAEREWIDAPAIGEELI